MSLETAIAELTAAVKEQNELTREILSKAAAASSRSSASSSSASTDDGGEDKPKRTRASKSDDKGDKSDKTEKAVTLDDVKPILSSWLNEFPKNGDDDHPETAARKSEFKAKLTELKAKSLPEVSADKLGDLKEWAEGMKAKGRLVKDEDGDEGDDDMLG